MDEENKPEQEYVNEDQSRPHVSVFGMDMDPGTAGSSTDQTNSSTTGSTTTKEDWRRQKEEWKAQRRAQKEQWKAQRHDWHDHHDSGFFPGLVIFFAGIVALLYTMGDVSSAFWHAITPFWPVLLILWGASIILGRHWFGRIILFLITVAFFSLVVVYGLEKINSPLINSLPPSITGQMNTTHPSQ
jgi:cell wall-active antibiotic response 4TMS protein YvqF